MIDTRLLLVLAAVALLGACDNAPTETDATPGEVLEGTISDAMLPVDRVRSEPPLADPAMFETEGGSVRPGTGAQTGASDGDAEAEEGEDSADDGASDEAPAGAAAPEPADPDEG